jgi:hypothetical protein
MNPTSTMLGLATAQHLADSSAMGEYRGGHVADASAT